MSNRLHNAKAFTMDDIAAELQLSKSTVSRALSGYGRISEDTVRRVKECADAHGFRPNLVAKALACKKTLNIAAVMPLESTVSQMMFYHECLSGIVSKASEFGYSVLVCMTDGNDNNALKDIVYNRKVDAVVLTQLKQDDRNVAFLRAEKFPFIVIGSCASEGIVQLDSKMKEACCEFTRRCVSKLTNGSKVLFVSGNLDIVANRNRIDGFLSGMEASGIDSARYAVCTNFTEVDGTALGSWDLILCADDVVCLLVIDSLKKNAMELGKDVLVASFHDSILLKMGSPAVSAIHVDAFQLGKSAAELAFTILSGKEYAETNYVDCSFAMRASTGD